MRRVRHSLAGKIGITERINGFRQHVEPEAAQVSREHCHVSQNWMFSEPVRKPEER